MTDAALVGGAAKVSTRWFYALMGVTTVAVALIGFMPTYFLPLVNGQFTAPAIVHIHGIIFFGWTVLFASQTWLVASGRTPTHRIWGMLGVAMATAMVFIVFATVAVRINILSAAGYRDQALAFSWIQIGGILLFATIFTLAVVNVKKPEVHKRLMLLGTLALLDAPIARWFLVFLAPPTPPGEIAPPPPLFIATPPALVADLLIVVAMVYDWRTRGKIHPVYLIGGAAVLLYQLTRPLIGETEIWKSIAAGIGGLGS
jgi:hypothetical protein